MSMGLTLNKADLDNRMAVVAMGIRDNLRKASELCDLLNNTNIVPNDAFLTGLNYTSTEVTTLRAAWTSLGGSSGTSLYRVAFGLNAGAGSPNNYFFDAQKFWGCITS